MLGVMSSEVGWVGRRKMEKRLVATVEEKSNKWCEQMTTLKGVVR
jgi:hypothetical protein